MSLVKVEAEGLEPGEVNTILIDLWCSLDALTGVSHESALRILLERTERIEKFLRAIADRDAPGNGLNEAARIHLDNYDITKDIT